MFPDVCPIYPDVCLDTQCLASHSRLDTSTPFKNEAMTGQVFELIMARGSTLVWAIIKGALIWGGIGLVLALMLYVVGTRRGWVDIRGRASATTHVVYGLLLFLGVMPFIAGSGVVHEMGEGTVRIVRDEIQEAECLEQVGGVLVAPLVLAHMVTQGSDQPALPDDISWSTIQAADVSFLLDGVTR
jgi:hypothetical protein